MKWTQRRLALLRDIRRLLNLQTRMLQHGVRLGVWKVARRDAYGTVFETDSAMAERLRDALARLDEVGT